MERIRLTKRASRSKVADSATPETAIDLGKNRTYHDIDEYHTFKQTVNHELPDMKHDWKDNPREETGHGIPKMAKIYMSAKKATKLATLFLGSKADAEAVEKQARAFMRMGDRALTASLSLYAECQGEDCTPAAPVEADGEAVEEVVAPAPVEANDAEVAAPAPVEANDAEVAAPAAPVEADDETVEEEVVVEEDVVTEPADVEVDEDLLSTDVEFDDNADVAEDADAVNTACAELAACFSEANEEGEEVIAPVTGKAASQKAGVKKLAGQPTLVRVASKKADELSALWDNWSNPDIR